MTEQPLPGDEPQDRPWSRDQTPAAAPPPQSASTPTEWSPQYWQPPRTASPPPVWIPPGQYPPPGYVPYQPPPYNTLAILALVLGIMVLPPLGIYFGKKAQQQIAETGERGVELAKAGVVVGWILTSLYGLFFCVWCGFVVTFFSHTPQ